MKDEKYFTVLTSDSGIVDKLAYQMRILYNLGVACGYQYIHTPISFGRSWQSNSFKKNIDKFEKIILFRFGIRIPKNIEKIVGLLERYVNKMEGVFDNFFNPDKYNTLNTFLGMDKFDLYVNDKKFAGYKIVEVPFEKVFANGSLSSFSQLREAIEKYINKTERSICCFSANHMYSYLAEIEQLLSKTNGDVYNYQYLNFSERYWGVKDRNFFPLPFEPGKIKIVIHIRRGDSMSIDLGSQKIYLHGEVIPYEEFEKVLKVDAGREIEIKDYELPLQKMFNEFGESKFSCLVISDGFDLSLSRISRAIARGKIKLNPSELKVLRRIGDAPEEQFASLLKYPNVTAIIGESNANLLKSIHALACADIVIYGSIGFSYGVHLLFRKNKSSVMINLKDFDAGFLDSIGKLIKGSEICQNNDLFL